MILNEAVARTPGRMVMGTSVQTPPKPSAEETEWRSAIYVSARNTADGNSYAPGDPIPEGEAIRQGVYVPEPGDEGTPIKLRAMCPRCGGTGLRAKVRPKGHKHGCLCPMCGPCPTCEGSRYVKKEVASDG